MQFPVPQFTEVEDKIIGTLTLKQFGILFGAGVLIFLAFSASGKNLIVGIVFGLLFGLPAVGVAFAKINGRPLYNSFSFLVRFITSPKVYVFHKEASTLASNAKMKDVQMKSNLQQSGGQEKSTLGPEEKLMQVNTLLKKQAAEEKELAQRVN